MKPTKTKTCIGYGDFEGICRNLVDVKVNPHWCLRCDKIRRKTITASLKGIVASMGGENEMDKG